MECLILRFDAPMMSFGSVVVDHMGPTWRFPGKSMLVGLCGNAMGWDHRDGRRLSALQDSLRHAARWDAQPNKLTDYQTVDSSQDFMVGTGWTTWGDRIDRSGDPRNTTHERWRDYWANGVATVAIALDEDDEVTVDGLESALRTPARPLFIGRKHCLPSTPILIGRREAAGVKAALAAEPLADVGPRTRTEKIEAMWPLDEGEGVSISEPFHLRDWARNFYLGTERYAVGVLEVSG